MAKLICLCGHELSNIPFFNLIEYSIIIFILVFLLG